jgi:probable O-glycosylation ligase (exosortase A-associated)
MRDILILFFYSGYMVLGLRAPFVFGLGYVWTDIFLPQYVAYSIMRSFPLALVMGAATLGSYVLFDRRDPPRLTLLHALMVVMIVWVTFTTTWAEVTDLAWFKWDWAVKTMVFTAFMPFLFRSRVQLEALILTFLFSMSGHLLATGLKTAIAGGGYGRRLGLVPDLVGVGETSFLSMLAAVSIPLIMFLKKHSLIIPKFRHTALGYNVIAVIAVLASLGTFARTGLVALGVLGALLWAQSKQKLLSGLGLMVAGTLVFLLMSQAWLDRMSTITNPGGESSAGQRVEMWKWTLNYVAAHPLGGGFNMYPISSFVLRLPDGTEMAVAGRAFHSMYFEVLGEHGYPGLVIFIAILLTMFVTMFRLRRKTRGIPELEWMHDRMKALLMGTFIYLCGGAFIGIAFQPPLYYFMAIIIAATQYYARAMERPPARAWEPPQRRTAPVPARPLANARRSSKLARET